MSSFSTFRPLVTCNKSSIKYPFFNKHKDLPVFFEVEDFLSVVGDDVIKTFPVHIWEKILFYKFVIEKINFSYFHFFIYREVLLTNNKKVKGIIRRNNLHWLKDEMKKLKRFLFQKVRSSLCSEGCEGNCYHTYTLTFWKFVRDWALWLSYNDLYFSYPKNYTIYILLHMFDIRLQDLEDKVLYTRYNNVGLYSYAKHIHETEIMMLEIHDYLISVKNDLRNRLDDPISRDLEYKLSLFHYV